MKIFSDVSSLAAATLTADQIVKVKSVGDYRIQDSGTGIALANGKIAVPQASGTAISVKQFGAVGDGVTDDTAAFTNAASASRFIMVPYISGGYNVTSSVVNSASTFIFEGDATQLAGTATAAQLKAVFFDGGQLSGIPFVESLRSSKIGVVAGTIRQNSTTRTQWDYINDSVHIPVGVSGTHATATGGSITIPYDTTYSRIISFVCGPDETFANAMGMTVGASVGLSSSIIKLSANTNIAATCYYDGATWQIANGTAQNGDIVAASYLNGTLTLTHEYCRGLAYTLTAYTINGLILNPYIPVAKLVGNSSISVHFIDPATGNVVTSASPDTRMSFVVTKTNNDGLFVDGTNDATIINRVDMAEGNIWFLGIFEK